MNRTVLVGFDSAWTDNPRNPGGICAQEWVDGVPTLFHPPRLARFDEAERFVADLAADATLLLVAIDQPTVVPNRTGTRPVDRIAARLIGRLKGGVQPACRDGFGARMFGDDAPIWRFLDRLDLQQDPDRSRRASAGRFAIEVYPALALPAIVPSLFERRRGAKYNPAVRRHFLLEDWKLVCDGLAREASAFALSDLSEWAALQCATTAPRKADQDRLDAALCLLIATAWRLGPAERVAMIGCLHTGYVVTMVSPETGTILRTSEFRAPQASAVPDPPTVIMPTAPLPPAGKRVDATALPAVLVGGARKRARLT